VPHARGSRAQCRLRDALSRCPPGRCQRIRVLGREIIVDVRPLATSVALGLLLVMTACGGAAKTTASRMPSTTSPAPSSTSTRSAGTGATLSCTSPAATLRGFHITSWTFGSTSVGWALGSLGDGQSGCAVIARTIDGGKNWALAPSPITTSVADPACVVVPNCLKGIRFATASDGYLFGANAFFVTTDGGATWHRESSLPVVVLEVSDGTVYRLVSSCPAGQCNETVEKAAVGSTSWTTLGVPPEDWSQVVPVSSSLIYLLGRGQSSDQVQADAWGDLWRSRDGGTTWTHLGNPCGSLPTDDPAFNNHMQSGNTIGLAAKGSAVAAACVSAQIGPQSAGYQQDVILSEDEGTTFGQVRPVPQLPGFDHSSGIAEIALATASDLVTVGTEGGAQSSFDSGASWTTTIPQPSRYASSSAELVGFDSVSTGHVVFPGNTVWTTMDGGRTWSSYSFP
jgi:hypothetical protein